MALRFAVQADTQQECARGLKELCERLGLQPAMLPRLLTDNRWMARAVPAGALKASPADDGSSGIPAIGEEKSA